MKNSLLALMFLSIAGAAAAAPGGKVSDCDDCGTVTAVDEVRAGDGRASGAGLVIGAVIGGVAGHQFGSGRGNDAATAAGAVGGAAAGHQIEKNRNAPSVAYRVRIDMDRGPDQTVNVGDPAGLRKGDRVRVKGPDLERLD